MSNKSYQYFQVDEQLRFSNSDMTLSSSISSLSNADNSGQLLTLMKSTSGISAAQTKPLSAITNDFTKYSIFIYRSTSL